MVLSAGTLTSLKSTRQFASCRFISFPEYEVESVGSIAAGAYTFLDIDGSGSVQRGGAASTGHVWTLQNETGGAAAGSKVDNGDETVYTAPAAGSGIDRIQLQTDGFGGTDKFCYIAYGDVTMNIGAVTAFHADIDSGGWEMTVRGYGDCSDLARQKVILLKIDAYWNGSASTFGGYSSWANGVFVGLVDRIRTVHEDSEHTYLECTLISPEKLLNYAEVEEQFWATAGAAEEITVATLKVLDIVWGLLQEATINDRFNVFPFTDDLAITNLKLSRGPVWDVAADVAARSFFTIYSSRTADIYVRPDPDVRHDDYYGVPTDEFTLTTDLFDAIDIYTQDIDFSDPQDPSDQTIAQIIMTAIQPDLTEIWARYPSDGNKGSGKTVEVGGLVCETATTLETWAGRYMDKLQPNIEADIRVFLFPVVDLYMWVGLTFTPDTGRITNTGLVLPSAETCYVTSVDFTIDPGMGTWAGSIHVVNQADQVDYTGGFGENSSD
jgi:hypothetical protein